MRLCLALCSSVDEVVRCGSRFSVERCRSIVSEFPAILLMLSISSLFDPFVHAVSKLHQSITITLTNKFNHMIRSSQNSRFLS